MVDGRCIRLIAKLQECKITKFEIMQFAKAMEDGKCRIGSKKLAVGKVGDGRNKIA